MFSTFLNWGNRRSIFETDKLIYERLRQFPEYASKGIINPIYPIWVDVNTSWMGKEQKATIEILQGSADLKQISRTTTKHVYNIIATSPVKIRENTFYYPGWKLKVNEVEKPIQYSTSSYPGLIVFDLPKGNHIVELTFQDTSIMLISEIISVSTAFGMLLVFLITTNRKSIKKFQIRQIFLR